MPNSSNSHWAYRWFCLTRMPFQSSNPRLRSRSPPSWGMILCVSSDVSSIGMYSIEAVFRSHWANQGPNLPPSLTPLVSSVTSRHSLKVFSPATVYGRKSLTWMLQGEQAYIYRMYFVFKWILRGTLNRQQAGFILDHFHFYWFKMVLISFAKPLSYNVFERDIQVRHAVAF